MSAKSSAWWYVVLAMTFIGVDGLTLADDRMAAEAAISMPGYDVGLAGRGFHGPQVFLPGSQGRLALVRKLAAARRCAGDDRRPRPGGLGSQAVPPPAVHQPGHTPSLASVAHQVSACPSRQVLSAACQSPGIPRPAPSQAVGRIDRDVRFGAVGPGAAARRGFITNGSPVPSEFGAEPVLVPVGAVRDDRAEREPRIPGLDRPVRANLQLGPERRVLLSRTTPRLLSLTRIQSPRGFVRRS